MTKRTGCIFSRSLLTSSRNHLFQDLPADRLVGECGVAEPPAIPLHLLRRSNKTVGHFGEIRTSFDRRGSIDNIVAVKGVDLEISKENNETVVTATWQPRITLFTGYTLLIDFTVSTADGK